MKASRHPLYHRFLNQLKKHHICQKKILAACSGGLDSLVLLDLLVESSSILNLKIALAHVHHGVIEKTYRDWAQDYVYSISLALDLPFFTNSAKPAPSYLSEEKLRALRYSFLQKWRVRSKSNYLALAHTTNDLLETRLIRLIRGTGSQGLVSMHFQNQNLLRPCLFFTRKEMEKYAHFRKINYLEDPTNCQTDPLRNWIRCTWLKQLEKRQPQSIQNLSRSLENIVEALPFSNLLLNLRTPRGLDKLKLMELSSADQRQALAQYIKKLGLKNYKTTHIQEILKHIQKNKNTCLKLAGKIWVINKRFIK